MTRSKEGAEEVEPGTEDEIHGPEENADGTEEETFLSAASPFEPQQLPQSTKPRALPPVGHERDNGQVLPPPISDKKSIGKGAVIKGRWEVLDVVDEGAFGQVFSGRDLQRDNQLVAIKVEEIGIRLPQLETEVSILRALQGQQHIARFFGCGYVGNVNFLVMQYLGENLHNLRFMMPSRTFTVATTFRLGMQMLQAIQEMHEHGFLHRDIKPANFLMGHPLNGEQHWLYIIDFGLGRAYTDLKTSKLRQPRRLCRFKGTTRYASVESLRFEDTSRRDDLWSLFYVILEMLLAELPWNRENEMNKIIEMKETTDYEYLLDGLPPELLLLLNHIRDLTYYARPNYDMLYMAFENRLEANGVQLDDPYDWEVLNEQLIQRKVIGSIEPNACARSSQMALLHNN